MSKRCPTCEASFAGGTFCELCGDLLTDVPPSHTGKTGPPTLPVALPPSEIPLFPSPDARSLGQLAQKLTPGAALEIVRKILVLAAAFEREELAWQPQPEDFRVEPSGDVVLSQARAVGRLQGQPFDVRRVLWAVREILLPHPLVGAGADAIRFVSGRIESRAASDAIATLDAIVRRSILVMQGPVRRAAFACDIGLLRERNEDAVAVAEDSSWSAAVVCDGVSSSSHGEIASRTGADVALASIAKRAKSLEAPSDADLQSVVFDAIVQAHNAILQKPIPDEGRDPSGTTIVAALVFGSKMAIGWAGDSRAYLVDGAGARLVTCDHSWLNQARAAGIVQNSEDMTDPLAHALTRCIGPLELAEGEGGAQPDTIVLEVSAPAKVVLCSDGLWGYFPTPESLGDTIDGAQQLVPGRAMPAAMLCQILVDHALARGGQDNVSVAICDIA